MNTQLPNTQPIIAL